jgi:hypothetical protein
MVVDTSPPPPLHMDQTNAQQREITPYRWVHPDEDDQQ